MERKVVQHIRPETNTDTHTHCAILVFRGNMRNTRNTRSDHQMYARGSLLSNTIYARDDEKRAEREEKQKPNIRGDPNKRAKASEKSQA